MVNIGFITALGSAVAIIILGGSLAYGVAVPGENTADGLRGFWQTVADAGGTMWNTFMEIGDSYGLPIALILAAVIATTGWVASNIGTWVGNKTFEVVA